MSMIGNLLRVTKAELDEYLNNSSLLEDRIYNDEAADAALTDIDKPWEGIIFLLTGQGLAEADHPLVAVLFSGQFIDSEQNLGYGPAHYVTPEQVAELNSQIARITEADLRRRFIPAKMKELGVYPEIWDEGIQAFAYLMEYFAIVRQVYSEAAKKHEAMITFVS